MLNAPIGVSQKIVGVSNDAATDSNNYLMEVATLAVTAAMPDSVQIGGPNCMDWAVKSSTLLGYWRIPYS